MFELKCCYHMIYTGKFQASLKSIFFTGYPCCDCQITFNLETSLIRHRITCHAGKYDLACMALKIYSITDPEALNSLYEIERFENRTKRFGNGKPRFRNALYILASFSTLTGVSGQ